jgi:hypothetical protein
LEKRILTEIRFIAWKRQGINPSLRLDHNQFIGFGHRQCAPRKLIGKVWINAFGAQLHHPLFEGKTGAMNLIKLTVQACTLRHQPIAKAKSARTFKRIPGKITEQRQTTGADYKIESA